MPYNSDYYAYSNALRRRGFVPIGTGSFSTVYAKPGSDRVIKICTHGNDMAWIAYMHWANKTPFRRRFAPALHSLKFHCGFYVAVMDRVERLYQDDDAKEVMGWLRYPFGRRRPDLTPHPGLRLFVKALHSKFSERCDLHNGNWGQRADGSVVIFDPVADFEYQSDDELMRRYKSSTRLAA